MTTIPQILCKGQEEFDDYSQTLSKIFRCIDNGHGKEAQEQIRHLIHLEKAISQHSKDGIVFYSRSPAPSRGLLSC